MLEGALDSVSEVFIEQCVFQAGPQPVHSIEIGFETDGVDVVDSARFRFADTPDQWVVFTDSEVEDGGEEWWFELETADPADLTIYDNRDYVFEFTFAGGEVQTTTVSFSDPDTGLALAQPTQEPVFTSPIPFATAVPLDVTLQWQPVVDSTIGSMDLSVERYDAQADEWNEVVEQDFQNTTTSSFAVGMLAPDAVYNADIIFDNARTGFTAEGVEYFVTKCTEGSVTFTTFSNLLDPVSDVSIVRGFEADPFGGDGLYTFEFAMESPADGWFAQASITTPTGASAGLESWGQTDDNGWEWGFEFVNGDESALSDFGAGTYTLVLDLMDGTRVATQFDYLDPADGSPLELPADTPVFLAPVADAQDVATDVTFQWNAVTDPNVVAIEIGVEDLTVDADVIEETYGPDMTSHMQNLLAAGHEYSVELAFVSGDDQQVNAQGVPYAVGAYRAVAVPFATAGQVNPLTLIDEVFIERSETAAADGQTIFEFEFGIESAQAGWFETAAFQVDGGAWLALSGDFFEGDPAGEEFEDYEWYFEVESTNAADLAAFGAGVYTLQLTFADGSTAETSFPFDDTLVAPAQTPVFTTPTHGAVDVPKDVTFAWEAVADPNVDVIFLDVDDVDFDKWIIEAELEPTATQFTQNILPGGANCEAELEFGAESFLVNADGVSYISGFYTASEIEFATAGQADPLMLINEVFIERSETAAADGQTIYEFEFGMESAQAGWFETAAFQVDGGAWRALSGDFFEGDPAGDEFEDYEWYFEVESTNSADLAAFGAGVYTLQLTFADGSTVETSFPFDDTLVAPSQTPVFTTPTHGAVDVPKDVTFAWETVTDPNVDVIFLDVDDLDFDQWIIEADLEPTATQFMQNLLPSLANCEAELEFGAESFLVNADGVSYISGLYTASEIEFATVDSGSPFDQINTAFIDCGTTVLPGGEDLLYEFEFGFDSATDNWFGHADIQFNGGEWLALTPEVEDGPGGQPWYGWFYEAETTDPLVAAAMSQATATLRLTMVDASTVTTTFWIDPALNAPAEVPVFTTPLDGAVDAPVDVTFAWQTATDPNIDMIWFDVEEAVGGESIIEVDLAPDAADWPQNLLSPTTTYTADVEFVVTGEGVNVDGVNLLTNLFSGAAIEFATGQTVDPISLISGAAIEQGVVELPSGGGTEYSFEFAFGSETSEWVESARLQSPTGAWFDLTMEPSHEDGWVYQWAYEASSLDIADAALFPDGTYRLELTLPGGSTTATPFAFDATITLPGDAPQFLAPLDGAVDVPADVAFTWTPANPPVAAQYIEVEDLVAGDEVMGEFVDPTVGAFAQAVLQGNRAYAAELTFANGGLAFVNANNVPYSAVRYHGAVAEFVTADVYDPTAMLDEVFIEHGYTENVAEGGAVFSFEFGFLAGANDFFQQARFQAPGGSWYVLAPDSGNDHAVDEFEWFYEVETDNPLHLAEFVPGVYTLEFTSSTGAVATTEFTLAADVTAPTTVPQFVAPLDGAVDVPADVVFAWNEAADPNIATLWMDVVDVQADEWVIETDIDPAAASYAQQALQPATAYEAELAFVVGHRDLQNADGVLYGVANFTAQEIAFTTAAPFDPLTMIDHVFIERGVEVEADRPGPMYVFEFGMVSPEDGWFDTAEFQVNGGSWHELAPDMDLEADGDDFDDDGYEWFFEVFSETEADLAEFGAGVYTLRLTYGQGDQVTTEFLFDEALTAPADTPTFSSPTADAVVDPNVDFLWASQSPVGADLVIFEVETLADEETVFEVVLPGDSIGYDALTLEFGTAYEAFAAYFATEGGTVNADGVSYSTGLFNAAATTFSTVEATVDLVPQIFDVQGFGDPILWGDSAVVTAIVTNAGTDIAVGQVTMNVYLSTDTALDDEDLVMGSTTTNVNLSNGAAETMTVDVTVPSGIADGEYYLLASVVTDDAIVEDSTTNNTVATGPRLVRQPIADLTATVDAVSFTGRVLAGEAGTVTVTAVNEGTAKAGGDIVIQVYASASGALDADALLVGKTVKTGGLDIGATMTREVAVRVPADAETNDYYLIAVVDPADRVAEGDEADNEDLWATPVHVEAPVVDLSGDFTAFSYVGSVLPGTAGTATVTLVNNGNTTANKKVVTRIWASTTGELDENAVVVGSLTHTVNLAADGGAADAVVNVKIPAGLAASAYFLIAEFDAGAVLSETDETNNLAVSQNRVEVVAPVVDLVGEVLDTGLVGTVVAGASGSLHVQVANDGNVAVSGKTIAIQVVLAEGVDPAQGVVLKTISPTLTLQPQGEAKDLVIPYTIPAGTATGQYNLLVVLDAADKLDESVEDNNVVTSGAAVSIEAQVIDLVATVGETVVDDPLLPGATGLAAVTMANAGNTKLAGANVAVTVYGSLTADVDETAIVLGTLTRKVTLDAAGGQTVYNVPLRIPDNAAFESYNLLAVVDTADAVAEGDEANNLAAADATFTVVEPFKDLVCEIVDTAFGAAVLPGDQGRLTVNITNAGNVAASGAVAMVVYASDDGVAGGDIEVARMQTKVSLAPGAVKAFAAAVTIPAEMEFADELHFVAVVESAATVEDSEPDNDVDVVAGPVLEEVTRDLAGEVLNFSMPEVIIAGDRALAKVALTNAGNMPVVGEVAFAAYAQSVADPGAEPIALGDAEVMTLSIPADGGSKTILLNVEIPDTLAVETEYQLFVRLDAADAVEEIDEVGNDVLLGQPRLFVRRFGSFAGHANVALTLADDFGEPVTFTLRGGGYGVAELSGDGGFEINLYETTDSSQATIATADGHVTEIRSLTTDGDLRSLKAENADLIGSMTFTGGVGQLLLNDVADEHAIDIGLSEKLTADLRFGDVTDLSITSASPIKMLTVNQWLDTDETPDTIDAPWIGSLVSAGDFEADLLLSGVGANRDVTLNSARIGGALNDVDWTLLTGDLGAVTVNGDVAGLFLSADNAKALNFADVITADVTLTGEANTVKAANWLAGSFDVGAVRSLTLDGDFGASLTLADALNSARIGGSIIDGTWTLGGLGSLSISGATDNWTLDLGAGELKNLTLATVSGTTILAGAVGTVRADAWTGGGFDVDSLKTLMIAGDFSGSLNIASADGQTLGSVKVGGDMLYDDPLVTDWAIAGSVGVVNIAGTVDNFRLLVDGSVRSFVAGQVATASLGEAASPIGAISRVSAGAWGGGSIVAEAVNTLKVDGDFGAAVTLDAGEGRAFNSARIGGSITDGAWSVTGAMGALRVDGAVANWSLDLGAADLRSLTLGAVTDTDITAATIGSVKADSWTGGVVTAASVKSVVVTGDFGADFNLSDTGAKALSNLRVGGDITGGAWTVAGGVSAVKVSGAINGGVWDVAGPVKSLLAADIGAATITADSIVKLAASGDMTGATIMLTQALDAKKSALKQMNIGGVMASSEVRTVGSVGKVKVGAMIDSVLFAGVSDDYDDLALNNVPALPVLTGNYVDPEADLLATITSFTIAGGRNVPEGDLMVNSNVAAGVIRKATVIDVRTDNGGDAFGFAAVKALNIVWRDGRTNRVWGRSSWPADTGDFTVTLATTPQH